MENSLCIDLVHFHLRNLLKLEVKQIHMINRSMNILSNDILPLKNSQQFSSVLEPYAVKVASTVLRGGCHCEVVSLPDKMEGIIQDIIITLQSNHLSIYIKAIMVIQVFIALYMIILFIEILINHLFIKILYIVSSIFILALGGDLITNVLSYCHNSNTLSFILGLFLTFAMLFAAYLKDSRLISPILLAISFIVIAISLDGSLLWSSKTAIWGTAGKVFALMLFHSFKEKILNNIE